MTSPRTARGQRADASRNRDAIIDAALRTLNTNPTASIAEIAAAAGISRITFYGHFSSREELFESVFARTMERIDEQFGRVEVGGAAWPALERLLQTQWRLVDELSGIVRASENHLSAERIREFHARPMERVRNLIRAGRDEGVFRTDHTVEWQIACLFAVLHGAAAELRSGRLTEKDAARVIPQTVQAMLQAP